jgi:hypothetical protein
MKKPKFIYLVCKNCRINEHGGGYDETALVLGTQGYNTGLHVPSFESEKEAKEFIAEHRLYHAFLVELPVKQTGKKLI